LVVDEDCAKERAGDSKTLKDAESTKAATKMVEKERGEGVIGETSLVRCTRSTILLRALATAQGVK
jgi:hypothetical protein